VNNILIFSVAILACTAVVAQDTPVIELSRFSAKDAHQAVAVDETSIFAISNRSISRYEKDPTKQERNVLASWSAPDNSQIHHLNSGMVIEGKLYCANSHWPMIPLKNSIEIFSAETLEHVDRIEYYDTTGAINWIDHHDGSWWIVFAFYGEKDVRQTRIVKYDDDWRETGRWTFPESVVQRFLPMSNSGGGFGPDGKLFVTGHDHAELYVLEVPIQNGELKHLRTLAAPISGQGIAWDKHEVGTLYGIIRKTHDVVSMKVPFESPN